MAANWPNYCQKSQLEEWGYVVAISSNGNYLAVGSRGTGDVKVYDYTIGIWRQAGRDMTLIG